MGRRLAIVLGILVAGCGVTTCGAKQAGLPCASEGECRAGHGCVAGLDGARRCMLPCTAGTFLCPDGALCVDRGEGGNVCWFGGTVPQHFPCAATVECEAGTHCVDIDGARACEQACVVETDRPCRPEIEECVPVPATPAIGWCRAIPQFDAGPIDAAGAGP